MDKIKENLEKINETELKDIKEKAKSLKFFNIGFFLWFLISFFITWKILTPILTSGSPGKGLFITLIIYSFSIYVSLTPPAEFIFRKIAGARPVLTRKEKDFLDPIFAEVYEKARQADGNLPSDVKLYIVDDPRPNASAIGRRTVTVTKGLMENMEPNEIKAVLSHELAHIKNGDTQAILVAVVGNFVLAAILFVIRIIATFFSFFLRAFGAMDGTGIGGMAANAIGFGMRLLDLIIFSAVVLGVIAARFSSRQCEFQADNFSVELGYGPDMISCLEKLEYFSGGPRKLGLVQALSATHPATAYRIANLEKQLDLQ